MDLETWFQIHTNVSNFEMASPKTIQMLKKLLNFVTLVKFIYLFYFIYYNLMAQSKIKP